MSLLSLSLQYQTHKRPVPIRSLPAVDVYSLNVYSVSTVFLSLSLSFLPSLWKVRVVCIPVMSECDLHFLSGFFFSPFFSFFSPSFLFILFYFSYSTTFIPIRTAIPSKV